MPELLRILEDAVLQCDLHTLRSVAARVPNCQQHLHTFSLALQSLEPVFRWARHHFGDEFEPRLVDHQFMVACFGSFAVEYSRSFFQWMVARGRAAKAWQMANECNAESQAIMRSVTRHSDAVRTRSALLCMRDRIAHCGC